MFILIEWDAIQSAQVVYYVPTGGRVDVRVHAALATAPREAASRQVLWGGTREHFEAGGDSRWCVRPELGSAPTAWDN